MVMLTNIKRLTYLYKQLSFGKFFKVLICVITGKPFRMLPHHLFCQTIVLIHQSDAKKESQKIGSQNILQHTENKVNLKVHLRQNTSDFFIYNQIFIRQDYSGLVYAISVHTAKKIQYIVDAGANIGCATLYFKCYFPLAEIIAIEPEESNFGMLSENMLLNDVDNVHCVKAALWNKQERLVIDHSFRDQSHSACTVNEAKGSNESLPGCTINSLLTTYDFPYIDIFKIDIEGAEKHLFEDPDCLNSFLPITRFIAIEVHEEFISTKQVIEILQSFGYAISTSGEYIVGINSRLVVD